MLLLDPSLSEYLSALSALDREIYIHSQRVCHLSLDLGIENGFKAVYIRDLGIASQNILLGASEKGFGGCRIASISSKLRNVLELDDHLQILLVMAIGKPAEAVSLEGLEPEGNIKYWRDAEGVHHVPKRTLHEIIAGEFAG